jgi:hypothetical protein
VTLTSTDLTEVRALHLGFVALKDARKKALRVAMRRLNLAMRREWSVDSALDLGICLEMLFLDGKPADSSIGFALRVRAARLLRQDVQERKDVASVLSALYKLRSSAAHSGDIPDTVNGVPAMDFLRLAAGIASEAIRTFVARGFPDWEDVVYS